jgi:hypothetical protein
MDQTAILQISFNAHLRKECGLIFKCFGRLSTHANGICPPHSGKNTKNLVILLNWVPYNRTHITFWCVWIYVSSLLSSSSSLSSPASPPSSSSSSLPSTSEFQTWNLRLISQDSKPQRTEVQRESQDPFFRKKSSSCRIKCLWYLPSVHCHCSLCGRDCVHIVSKNLCVLCIQLRNNSFQSLTFYQKKETELAFEMLWT